MKVAVWLQQHVALVDAGPAADRRAVNAESIFKKSLRQLRDRIGDVVPEAGNIGEAQVENSCVVLLRELKNGLGISHPELLAGKQFFSEI